MKLLIAGGNMATNNVMQIRVMPSPTANARLQRGRPGEAGGPHLMRASYGGPQVVEAPVVGMVITLASIMEGMIGYSQGRGAQALGQVPVVAPSAPAPGPPPPPSIAQGPPAPPKPFETGTVKSVDRSAYVKRAGSDTWTKLNPGDSFYVGDILQSPYGSQIDIQMVNGTDWTIGSNSEWNVQYFQNNQPSLANDIAKYQVMQGTFMYVSGLLNKTPPGTMIEGCEIYGGDDIGCDGIGIRGTEFVLKVDPTAKTEEIDLIKGSVDITPAGSTTAGPAINAPMQIEVTPQGVQTLPLTQDQYNAIKAQNFPAPTS
jgi:uncharacterized protein YaiE (UPF0345 family)